MNCSLESSTGTRKHRDLIHLWKGSVLLGNRRLLDGTGANSCIETNKSSRTPLSVAVSLQVIRDMIDRTTAIIADATTFSHVARVEEIEQFTGHHAVSCSAIG